MTELIEADRAMYEEILAVTYGDYEGQDKVTRLSARENAHAYLQRNPDREETAHRLVTTVRALVTAELAARAAPDEAEMVGAMITPIMQKMLSSATSIANAALDAIVYHLAALQARAEKAEAEIEVWKSVFPDIAPEAVLPDRGKVEAELRRRAEKAEATIDRLRAVLDRLSRLGNEPHLGNSDGNMIAREALEASNAG